MIGVIANPSEHQVVCEFFELFKTPWEFYQRARRYDVLLCSGAAEFEDNAAGLIVIYASQGLPSDRTSEVETLSRRKSPRLLCYEGSQIPIYGQAVGFRGDAASNLLDEDSRWPVMQVTASNTERRVRIGYDLFAEVHHLLTEGQPAAEAPLPALDLHIALLRDLIVESGLPLAEIPPVPEGHTCIACLTHDVDHPLVRRHKWDHTMFGFLYRAAVGSLRDLLLGRISLSRISQNWLAVLRLPFVHLGWAEDFWSRFDDYTKLEAGLPSSFFVISFAGTPGGTATGSAPRKRAAGYGAADIARQIQSLASAGCEIGLHGIDAWRDSSKGVQEFDEIRRVAGAAKLGVRMHWLYFDQASPRVLEQAGAQYDSTVGYNQTIGYRAGTTQVYKPFDASYLLELPLHIMDTALFYPGYLHLSTEEADKEIRKLISHAARCGGVVTVNWHDRSIAPERLWTDSYLHLIDELKEQHAWFATASQAVSWFRKRRSATFVDGNWKMAAGAQNGDGLPGLQLRVYNAAGSGRSKQQGAGTESALLTPTL